MFDCSARIAPGSRLLRRHSGTKKRVPSLLLSTAARDPGVRAARRAADSDRARRLVAQQLGALKSAVASLNALMFLGAAWNCFNQEDSPPMAYRLCAPH